MEITELKSQQRIAELEARVALAEQEAAAARLETEKLRQETESRSNSNFGLRTYYTLPHNYYYRPPTITIYQTKNHPKATHHKPDQWNYNHYIQPNQQNK